MSIIKKLIFFSAFALAVLDANGQSVIAVWGNNGTSVRIRRMPSEILHYDYTTDINFYMVPYGSSSNRFSGKMVLKLFRNVKESFRLCVDSEIGVCLSQINYPSVSDRTHVVKEISFISKDKEYEYTFTIEGLKPNTKYYFRPYFKIGTRTLYGDPGTFTTKGE